MPLAKTVSGSRNESQLEVDWGKKEDRNHLDCARIATHRKIPSSSHCLAIARPWQTLPAQSSCREVGSHVTLVFVSSWGTPLLRKLLILAHVHLHPVLVFVTFIYAPSLDQN